MAISFGSTAFGPVLFALVHDATGSYNYALLGTTALPLLVAVAASFTHAPAIPGATRSHPPAKPGSANLLTIPTDLP